MILIDFESFVEYKITNKYKNFDFILLLFFPLKK
jgi:hypothetical protein